MERTIYKELKLKIEPGGNNLYKVSASSSCGGDGDGAFTLDELSLDTTSANDEPDSTERKATLIPESIPESILDNPARLNTSPPSLKKARAFGRQLFQAIFRGEVGLILDRCLTSTRAEDNTQLRISLNLTEVPNLAGLPWEFLYRVPQNKFLARSYDSIVRYLKLNTPYEESLLKEPPLRVLVVLSSPTGMPKLDVEGELQKLNEAINQIGAKQQIFLDALCKPTIMGLRKKLYEHKRSDPYHVFHFIGHGMFDPAGKEGKLVLENETGGESLISAQELGEILATHPSFRLALINACEGARISPLDSYSGIAQTLLRSEAAPAVIAMQYVIKDAAAKIFAQYFYEALLKGENLDAAVTSARQAISDTELTQGRGDNDSIEWGTPVLYMRASDSRLVDFPPVTKQQKIEAQNIPVMSPLTNPLETHYQEVIQALHDGQLVPFLGLDVNLYDRQATPRPLGYDELVQRLANPRTYPYVPGASLARVTQYAQLPDKLAELYDELGPLLGDEQYTPTPLHNFWARIAKENALYLHDEKDSKRKRFLIVTTSYDKLLEEAFKQTVKHFHVFSYLADGEQERGKFFHTLYQNGSATQKILVDFSNKELADELPVILKLPGTIEEFNAGIRFAITEDQYFDLLTNRELNSILPSQVMNKLRGSHHLFLGCNLSDWTFRGLLYRIWNKPTPSYASWAVEKGLDEFGRKYWDASKVKIIDESLANYTTRLEAHLPLLETPGQS